MWVESSNLWLSKKELKNNNLNPEIEKVLEDNSVTQEERDVLHDIFSEKRSEIYNISKTKLNELRWIIWSKSKLSWITDRDMNKLKNYNSKNTDNKKFEKILEKAWSKIEFNTDKKIYQKILTEIRNENIKIDEITENLDRFWSYTKLIEKTPNDFKNIMKKFITKKITNSWEKIESIDIKDIPLIFLLNTKKKKGLAYINWNFKTFPIINTWWSLKWKVWKFSSLKISNNNLWDVSRSWSKTVVWASFMWEWMNAQWIHWVDKWRLWWWTSKWCVWIWSETIRNMANSVIWDASLISSIYRPWKSWKWRWKSVNSNVKTYKLNKPMLAYVV